MHRHLIPYPRAEPGCRAAATVVPANPHERMIIDSQIHLIAPRTPARPWSIEEPTLHGWSSFDDERILAEMAAAHVDRAVLVPSIVDGDRNDTALAAATLHPRRFATMGRLDLRQPLPRGSLATWRAQPGMLGVRVTFHRGGAAAWLTDGTADWFWPEAEAAGLPVYVHVPRQAPRLAEIAARHPDLRLAVDHFGLTDGVRQDEIDRLVDDVVALASLPNVSVKASGLPSLAGDAYPYPSMIERVRRVVDAFGPERVFWGSDLSRLKGSYDECVRMFTEELPFLGADDLRLVMGDALAAWLRWPPATPHHRDGPSVPTTAQHGERTTP